MVKDAVVFLESAAEIVDQDTEITAALVLERFLLLQRRHMEEVLELYQHHVVQAKRTMPAYVTEHVRVVIKALVQSAGKFVPLITQIQVFCVLKQHKKNFTVEELVYFLVLTVIHLRIELRMVLCAIQQNAKVFRNL
jgi:hypothetical protein